MRLQSRRVNTSLVGRLLKDLGGSERKGRGQVSTLRVGCRQGRTPCSACLLVLFLPPPHQLPHWWCGPQEGLDRGAWQKKGARSQYLPVREPQGSTPARGAPLQPGTLQAFTCTWGELHAWGSVEDTSSGQGRNGVVISLEVAGLLSCEHVRSGLVLPALLGSTDTLLCSILFTYTEHTCALLILSLTCLTGWLLKTLCNFHLCITSSLLLIHPSCFSYFLYSRIEFAYVILTFLKSLMIFYSLLNKLVFVYFWLCWVFNACVSSGCSKRGLLSRDVHGLLIALTSLCRV